jgi:hypothetical protein
VLKRDGGNAGDLVEQSRRQKINAGAHDPGTTERRILLDKCLDISSAIEHDTTKTTCVVDRRAEDRSSRAAVAVACHEPAQIGLHKTVAVQDEDRIAVEPSSRETQRAGGPKRLRLDHIGKIEIRLRVGAQVIDHAACSIAQPEHDPSGTKTP